MEIIGTGEREHYRVRWEDEHESLYFPGPDAHLFHTVASRAHVRP